jgi:fibronectin type 3 domain-containing protein
VKITPIAVSDDGTQIWKITHNGVDTHPIHFHLYDVQVINRVTWDNIIIQPDANELGWKDTVRISPLEDTIVALRPIIPHLPFDLPNSVRELSPMMPDGAELFPGLLADPQGNPITVNNHLINFGWEYVYHCHILSHEEMDMMRPVLVAVPPVTPSGLVFDGTTLSWTDNSLSETAFVVEKSTDGGTTWIEVNRISRALGVPNTTGELLQWINPTPVISDQYRVFAENTVGDTAVAGFPVVTVKSSYAYSGSGTVPAAPSNLSAIYQAVPQVVLAWTDNATNETGYTVERSTDGGLTFNLLASLPADSTSYPDTSVALEIKYSYRVYAFNGSGNSAYSNVATVTTPPKAPTGLSATYQAGPRVALAWTDNSAAETAYVVERSVNGGAFAFLTQLGANVTSYIDAAVSLDKTYTYRVYASNANGGSPYSNVATVTTPPTAPSTILATASRVGTTDNVHLSWTDTSSTETGFEIQRARNTSFTNGLVTSAVGPNITLFDTGFVLSRNTNYYFRVRAVNATGASAWVNASPFPIRTP